MKRWNAANMLDIGRKLFEKIYKKKRSVRHNHPIHFLAREIDDWLSGGVQSMINGTYTPHYLKRRYFYDEVVDQLHLSDRILQHILLKQLKPTIKHVTHPSCVHVHGPSKGIKIATQRIQEALKTRQYNYIIRADIRSFYKSISHFRLLDDLKKIYDDPKLISMFEQIIRNPIETGRGYKTQTPALRCEVPCRSSSVRYI
ncbi:MAG TPA: hypothetical protein VHA52_13825 [Candidatus Babeliaceae bacterium]|nr:hypothetical protein [Candidatus Babeliaceae bacterium]